MQYLKSNNNLLKKNIPQKKKSTNSKKEKHLFMKNSPIYEDTIVKILT